MMPFNRIICYIDDAEERNHHIRYKDKLLGILIRSIKQRMRKEWHG